MAAMAIDLDIAALERRKQRLGEDIRRQERLLEQVRGRVATAQRERVAAAVDDFDKQVSELREASRWLAESRRKLIERLRVEAPARAERGEQLDLARICAN